VRFVDGEHDAAAAFGFLGGEQVASLQDEVGFDAPYLWRDSRSTCNPEGVLLFGCWLGTAN